MTKENYMRRAIALAKRGIGYTNPNPIVGCVVVKDGRIISEGYHERYGQFHAERNALLNCQEDPAGAELYVTLEPCCHYGKTPPCTEIILEKKIRKVYVGSMDTNPKVGGKGVQILREAGVEVETGILEEECRQMNEVFFHFIETGKPFVVMKYAMTMDGKIACASGDSKWVTGEAARTHVHELRRAYRGIMVGIGTVLADDPMLNCRIVQGADPIRIVCDSRLRIPLNCRLVQTARDIPTIVACTKATLMTEECQEKITALRQAGVELVATGINESQVDLTELMQLLGEKKIDSILLEGGSTLNAAALQAGIVNKVYAYVAGKLIGGKAAPTPVSGEGAKKMSDAVVLTDLQVTAFGEDLCISGYPADPDKQREQEEGR